MVKINNIEQPTAEVLKELDNGLSMWVGRIKNYAQYLDFKVQVKEAQESGYFLMFKGEKVKLDKNGTEDHFPDGFFGDIETSLLLKLI